MNKKFTFLNEFYLKIIAYVFMTIDHIGIFIRIYAYNMGDPVAAMNVSNVLRILGRVAFPLIIFMIVEGVMHTKNFGKYILRLGVVTLGIMIFQILTYYLYDTSIQTAMSPFIDLVLAALTVYLLKRKDKFSFLAALPIGYSLLCYLLNVFSRANPSVIVYWLPFYLRADYSLIGTLLALGFYFASTLSVKIVKYRALEPTNDEKEIKESQSYCVIRNILSVSTVILVTIFVWLTAKIELNNRDAFDVFNAAIQTYMIFALIPLIFYNGKRGYNAKWFKYGSYLYFPLHIIILFVIFLLIFEV